MLNKWLERTNEAERVIGERGREKSPSGEEREKKKGQKVNHQSINPLPTQGSRFNLNRFFPKKHNYRQSISTSFLLRSNILISPPPPRPPPFRSWNVRVGRPAVSYYSCSILDLDYCRSLVFLPRLFLLCLTRWTTSPFRISWVCWKSKSYFNII